MVCFIRAHAYVYWKDQTATVFRGALASDPAPRMCIYYFLRQKNFFLNDPASPNPKHTLLYAQNHGTRMPLQEIDGEDEMEVEEEENQTSSKEA